MNRRGFLKWLGVGVAGVAVAPAALKVLASEAPTQSVCEPVRAYIAEYSDYASFSSLSLSNAIDEHVSNAAKELSYQRASLLNSLVESTGMKSQSKT